MLKKKKSARPTLFCTGPLLQYNIFFGLNIELNILKFDLNYKSFQDYSVNLYVYLYVIYTSFYEIWPPF